MPRSSTMIKCISPKKIIVQPKQGKLGMPSYPIENYGNGKEIIVGCGKCEYCRKRYATIGAKRCQMETIAQNKLGNKNNGFLTLTFEREPIKNKTIKNYLYTEAKKFIQKIRGKNRKYQNGKTIWRKIKYIGVSEFGATTGRAHLHMIVGNVPIIDKIVGKMSNTHNLMYYSNNITKLGGNGIVSIQDLTKENAAYLYKYEAKNYLQKCQSSGIGLTFFFTHLDDVLNEKQYQNRYFLKKYRELLGDTEYYSGMLGELQETKRFAKPETPNDMAQKILKLRDKLVSKNSKIGKARDWTSY